MKRLGIFGVASAICCLVATPLLAHDYYHHHPSSDSYGNSSDHNQPASRRQVRAATAAGDARGLHVLEGRIAELVYLPGPTPESAMVEIRLQSGGQTTLIRLAPSGYLKKGEMRLKEGELVTIKGFAIAGIEEDLIVATEIRQGNKGLNLRDGRGRSIW